MHKITATQKTKINMVCVFEIGSMLPIITTQCKFCRRCALLLFHYYCRILSFSVRRISLTRLPFDFICYYYYYHYYLFFILFFVSFVFYSSFFKIKLIFIFVFVFVFISIFIFTFTFSSIYPKRYQTVNKIHDAMTPITIISSLDFFRLMFSITVLIPGILFTICPIMDCARPKDEPCARKSFRISAAC